MGDEKPAEDPHPMHSGPAGSADRAAQASGTQAMRDLALRWVQSQAAISAYISANVSDAHHAEDLVQEVAQVVAEKYAEYDSDRSFTSWALGIARNRILKYYNTQARDRLVFSEAALGRLADALEKAEEQSEPRREALRLCLKKIAGRRREAIDLRYRDGARVTDIAEQFATSPTAVSVMLFRVRKSLLECVLRQIATEGQP